jgi:hypothetical protein
MSLPAGWRNPILVPAGQIQKAVDACLLLPSRSELIQLRLDFQRGLRQSGCPRLTSIQVTTQGIIWDGHHAVRVAAECGEAVDVVVIAPLVPASGSTILQLPVR